MKKTMLCALAFVVISGVYSWLIIAKIEEEKRPKQTKINDSRLMTLLSEIKHLDLENGISKPGWWAYTPNSSGDGMHTNIAFLFSKGQVVKFKKKVQLPKCKGKYKVDLFKEQELIDEYIGVKLFDKDDLNILFKGGFFLDQGVALPSINIDLGSENSDHITVRSSQQHKIYHWLSNSPKVLSTSYSESSIQMSSDNEKIAVLFMGSDVEEDAKHGSMEYLGASAYLIDIKRKRSENGREVISCHINIQGFEMSPATNEPEEEAVITAYVNSQHIKTDDGQTIAIKQKFDVKNYDFSNSVADFAKREDQVLFESLNDQGLLSINSAGTNAIVYPGKGQWYACEKNEATCSSYKKIIEKDSVNHDLLKQLYTSENGRYVRSEIRRYNNQRITSAILFNKKMDDLKATIKIGNTEVPYSTEQRFLGLTINSGIGGITWPTYLSVDYAHFSGNNPDQKVTYNIKTPKNIKEDFLVATFGTGGKLKQAGTAKKGQLIYFKGAQIGRYWNIKPRNGRDLIITSKSLGCSGNCKYFTNDDYLAVKSSRPDSVFWGSKKVKEEVPIEEQEKRKSINKENKRLSKALVITTNDGKGILYKDEKIQSLAKELGLVSLVGLGYENKNHLPAALVSNGFSNKVKTTINRNIQKIVNRVVLDKDKEFERSNTSYRQAKVMGENQISVVIMDASNQKGAILAAASSRGNLSQREEVDTQTIERVRPEISQLRWLPAYQNGRRTDYAYPGSIFKLVTALSVFDQIERLKNFGSSDAKDYAARTESILKGRTIKQLKKDGKERGYNFNPNKGVYPADSICKAKGSSIDKGIDDYLCHSLHKRSRKNKVGLVDAIKYSHNPWFSWVLDRMTPALFYKGGEGNKLITLQTEDKKLQGEIFPLQRTLRRLGMLDTINLLTGIVEKNSSKKPFNSAYLSPVFVDKVNDKKAWRRMSIGYLFGVTPVHFAAISASIANNEIVTPYILKSVKKMPIKTLVKNKDHLNLLKKGMREVVKKRGTASSQLGIYKNHIWGKTGTAQIPSTKLKRSLWMTGWFCTTPVIEYDGLCNGKLYAFTCKVAPFVGKRMNSNRSDGIGGGSICGAVMKDIIKELIPKPQVN